jgi:LuxR family transcriptional regulator, maltose regulon positive regulatory protein
MSTPIVLTKLFAPPRVARSVSRLPLIHLLDAGMARKLTLVCAHAGFGKSQLLGEWAANCGRPCAWLSLGAGEQNPHQFLAYFLAALQTVDAGVGTGTWALLQTTPLPDPKAVLMALINELAEDLQLTLLVLDDYHLIACDAVDEMLAFLVEHLPPQLHIAVATREEPLLPLARLRVQGQLTELRQEHLRFSLSETRAFLEQTMALSLSGNHVACLAERTEGWVAGLQMVGISLQGHSNPEQFIQSFSGNHRFLQDFLLEEVLYRQPSAVQDFLLRTSVLDRFCAELCEAVTGLRGGFGMLTYLQQANIFIVPLDAERRWFRFHHLFADLLRHRLAQRESIPPLKVRASEWYEAQGQSIEALQYAIAACDMDRSIRLIDCAGMPLYFRGASAPVTELLQSLSIEVLNSRPRLWVMLAWSLMMSGYPNQMAVRLQGALDALGPSAAGSGNNDLLGQLATLSAWAAIARNDIPAIHTQAQRAINMLDARNHAVLTAAHCAQGVGHQFAGNHEEAELAYANVLSQSQATGNHMIAAVAAMGLASIQLSDNRLHAAEFTYRKALQGLTDPTNSVACEAHLGLARISYEWNDLEAAESHARRSSRLARPTESGAGLSADVMLARILQLRERFDEASMLLSQAAVAAQTRRFTSRLKEVVALQALELVRRGEHAAAIELAQRHQLPLATAKGLSAQGNAREALSILESYRNLTEQSGRKGEIVRVMVAQVTVLHAQGKLDAALPVLRTALALGEPGSLVRTFVDEGPNLAVLLKRLSDQGAFPDYTRKVLAAFCQPGPTHADSKKPTFETEALSDRERDILRLIQQGRSNQEIGEALFLSLHTVKWHNQNIFDKLHVKRRTEAVARALALKLLQA